MIVQLFIIFYGIPELGRLITNDADNHGWTLAVIIGLSFNVGAYASEIIRGGIISIRRDKLSGIFNRNGYRQTVQRILPQAIRVSIPALGNTF